MQDFESGGPGSIPGRGKCDLDFFSFPITSDLIGENYKSAWHLNSFSMSKANTVMYLVLQAIVSCSEYWVIVEPLSLFSPSVEK